jgi:hypothetical protein
MIRPVLSACVLALATGGAAAAVEIDPFYFDLERQAGAAASRGDAFEAAKLYRTACFGMLDEPPRLAGCLLRLGVQQAAAGERIELVTTLRRLAEVDDRFGALASASAGVEERRAFVRAVAEQIEPEQWAVAPPGLRAEIQSVRAELDGATERSGRRRRPAEAEKEPAIGGDEEPGGGIALAPEVDASRDAVPLATPAVESAVEEEVVAEARALAVAPAPARADIAASLARLEPIASGHPERPELAELAAHLAYRASSWAECARWFRSAGEPSVDRALERFYFAVCLHESGANAEAREVLAPVASSLAPTPFVERYRNAILGTPPRP